MRVMYIILRRDGVGPANSAKKPYEGLKRSAFVPDAEEKSLHSQATISSCWNRSVVGRYKSLSESQQPFCYKCIYLSDNKIISQVLELKPINISSNKTACLAFVLGGLKHKKEL